MTLPSPIQTGAITGHLQDPAGRPLKGSVIARYTRQVILAPGATPPTTIVARSKSFSLDADGYLDIQGLILANSPGLAAGGLQVRLTFALTDQEGNKRPRPRRYFELTQLHPNQDVTRDGSNTAGGGGVPVSIDRLLPPGGTTGQRLDKLSDDDYDAGWVDVEALPTDLVTDADLATALEPYSTTTETETATGSAIEAALTPYATTSEVVDAVDAVTVESIGAQPAGSYASAADLDNTFGIATQAKTTADAATPSPFRLAPDYNIPVITFEPYDVWSDASTIPGSPGRLREKRVGAAETAAGAGQGSTGDLDLTGSTHYRYHGFPVAHDYAPNSTRLVQTTLKPGGSSQFAYWLFGEDYITSSPSMRIALVPVATNGVLGFITVDGLAISDRATILEATGGNPTEAVLTFPDARPRTIRIEGLNQNQGRFGGITVENGYTISKATNPIQRRIAFIGDSFVNGNGLGIDEGGKSRASETETFVWRLAKYMGADEVLQVGVGATGFVAGGGDGAPGIYEARVAAVLALDPDVLVFSGGYNDTTPGLLAAIQSALDASKSVAERYIIFTGPDPAVRAVYETAGASRGVPVASPDTIGIAKLADNIHPSYEGHQQLAEAAWGIMSGQRYAPLHHTHTTAEITDLLPIRVLAVTDPDPSAGAPAGFYFKQTS